MREPCMCGADDCRHCYPMTWRQAVAKLRWEESAVAQCQGCGRSEPLRQWVDARFSACCAETVTEAEDWEPPESEYDGPDTLEEARGER